MHAYIESFPEYWLVEVMEHLVHGGRPLLRVKIAHNLNEKAKQSAYKRPQKSSSGSAEYLSNFAINRRRSVQKDGVLHQILYAHAFNPLQEIPTGLLPCSEVDLCDMSGQVPEHNNYQVNT